RRGLPLSQDERGYVRVQQGLPEGVGASPWGSAEHVSSSKVARSSPRHETSRQAVRGELSDSTEVDLLPTDRR
ncbi:hypothetical protein, partial [Amycolatopsis sp. cmx-4-61]|uniref:hypothetical protein n=1 Tax=Amycolatopsis sp. cmx-4-61 TaxID=2790937 RepID=UPI00397D6408